MSGLEPVEPPPTSAAFREAHDTALQRIGWAILSLNGKRYALARRHLAEATAALQDLQRIQEGTHESNAG